MKKKSFILDLVQGVLFAFILAFLLVSFVILPCRVDGSSMYSTLVDKDFGYSFVFKRNIDIKRFDIAVIDVGDKLIVKRVIGMPNDTITYINNELYINGELYKEDYLKDVNTNDFSITLKEDEYYCLGDNRDVSKDSRYYGPFSKKEIKSTGFLVIYPFNRFGVKK